MGYRFEAVTGFFSAADPNYKFVKEHPAKFGLLDQTPGGWRNLRNSLRNLQNEATDGQKIKLIFLGRHGQGFHNFQAETVGEKLFIDVYARQYKNDQIEWGPDPSLTELGKQQAAGVSDMLIKERDLGMPVPTSFYVSPLQRACQTHQIVYGSVEAAESPLIVDNLREGLNLCIARQWKIGKDVSDPALRPVFTDNIRSTKAVIHERFPAYRFESGFTEDDEMWTEEYTESVEEHCDRTRKVWTHIFENDEADVVAISAHGGTCLTAQKLLGLPLQLPHVCAVLPLIIRATPLQ